MNKTEAIEMIDKLVIDLGEQLSDPKLGFLWQNVFKSLSTIKTALTSHEDMLFSTKPQTSLTYQLRSLNELDVDYPSELNAINEFYGSWLLTPFTQEDSEQLDVTSKLEIKL